jgi:large subunit ribosomal protein L21
MFAVLKTGGKQYKVAKDDIFLVEKLAGDAGDTVEFGEVLMLGGDPVTIGAPLIEGALVRAEVLEQTKGPKVVSFKKRRRKHSSQRKRGHRQQLTRVRIVEIVASGAAN